ncbi:hypothetical protein LSCM4_01232 [Leishmania orientalis]|uniref:Guanine nucleotide-binding protein subunit beta-like protein n=1 Tax=Leishmania orientalis TaxID=2249476 RepID=A0A836GWI2_9TRYP|nr:hypothetical protein LSCM4_01232 [Leishmania orientalis]
MLPSQSETPATAPPAPESPLNIFIPDRSVPAPFRLEEAPVYRDDWTRQHPCIHLLFHRDIITHLQWCAAACRYMTGGADGAVKLWRSELQPRVTSSSSAQGPVLIPEAHVTTLGGPVTDLRTSSRAIGNSEVAVIASTDGTLTLCRTGSGEVIRTLRGARGESLKPSGAIAAPRSGPTGAGLGKEHAGDEGDSNALAEEDREPRQPYSKAPAWYAADAYSCRLASSSDMAIVRRPVYTVRAYRSEAREVLAGPSNEYFQGLRAVAPTYEHFTQHEMMTADVLVQFSVAFASRTSTHTSAMPRQWYASAIALTAAGAAVSANNIGGPAASSSLQAAPDPLLLLGFPQGLMQVYVLPQRWFALHQHNETRLDPPAMRLPVFSGLLHSAAVLCIEVIVNRDIVVSVSEDGTTQLRRLSCLRAPLRQLGVVVSLPTPVPHAFLPTSASFTPQKSAPRQRVGSAVGHSRLVTCCCVDAEQLLLITGGTDHTLCWWSLMIGSSSSPIRIVSLRDAATAAGSRSEADSTPSSPTHSPLLMARGGYPVDVSLFRRRLFAECDNKASSAGVGRDGTGGSSSSPHSSQVGLFLLVLDTERVVRIFDALSGKLITYEIESRTAAAAAALSSGVVERANSLTKEIRLARYDGVNRADRVLLGGPCLVPWYLARSGEVSATRGHTASIIFSSWCASLKCAVTADAHHVLLWRLRAEGKGDPIAEVLRAWRIAAGVQSVALCDTKTTDEPPHLQRPSLFIAHRSEPVIGQYDCLLCDSLPEPDRAGLPQPRLLRRLSLHAGTSVDALAAVTVVGRSSSSVAHDTSAAEMVTNDAFVACHVTRRRGERELCDAAKDGCLYIFPLQLSRATTAPTSSRAPAAIDGEAELIAPLRELRLSGWRAHSTDSIASVLGLPCANLLVVGGRRALYTSTLSSMITSAVPCSLLPPAWAAAQHSNCRCPNQSMREVLPTAVFPGPLISLADSANLDMADSRTPGQENGVAVFSATLADSSLTGFLSRLAHIPHDTTTSAANCAEAAVCLVLSGSNDGLLQLWDVQHAQELWQCRAVPTREPITALTVGLWAARWLVAAGDLSGVVTLLDITSVVQVARQVVAADTHALQKPVTRPTERSRLILQHGECRMLDRWRAHADAVSGAFFTTASSSVDDAAATAPQLLTTGEDSVVMLWTLPSWALLSAHPLAASGETSGILLFRRGKCADASSRRCPSAPVRVLTSTAKLPWAARQVYVRWRQQYVRERLLDGEPTELLAGLTRFYKHADSADGITGGEREKAEPEKEESEEEAQLIDRVWAMLVADVRALSQFVAPPDLQGDKLAPASRPRTVLEAWCTSLSPGATAEFATVASSSSTPVTKHRPGHDTAKDGTPCEPATLLSVPSGVAGSPTPLLFAFADRCCDGRAGGGRSSARHRPVSEVATSASSVRECLRQALRAVVQSPVGKASSQRASEPSMASPQCCTSALGPPLLLSVAHPFASADETPPPPLGRSSPASDAMPNLIEVVNSETSRSPPGGASLSTACADHSYAVASNTLARQVADHVATPQRHVGFTDEGGEPRSTSYPAPTVPVQSPSTRTVVTCRVGYSARAPMVRSSSAERRAGPALQHGWLLRNTPPGDTRDVAMNRSATAPHVSEGPFVDDDGDDSGADPDTVAGAPYRGLAGCGVAAAVIQHANTHRRREEALQRVITRKQAKNPVCRRGAATDGTAERKCKPDGDIVVDPALRVGSVAFGLPQRSVRRASAATRRCERSPTKNPLKARIGGSSEQSGTPQPVVLTPPKATQVLVSDAYLTPVLARVGVSSALLPDCAAAAPTVTISGATVSPELAFDSAHSAWYTERQRRRAVAREKARLWNSQRLMKTLLEWTTPSVESSGGIAEQLSDTEGCVEDNQIIALGTNSTTAHLGNAVATAGRIASPPVLTLPPILALGTPTNKAPSVNSNAAPPTVQDTIASPDAAEAALEALLFVSPTTAIDAAVRDGLPSRKTLQAEMAAARVRMRQSVQIRAAHQRKQRAVAASSPSNQSPPATELYNDSADVPEELGSGDTDSLSEEQRCPHQIASAGEFGGRSHEVRMTSGDTIHVTTPVSALGKSRCAPRRALQTHEGAEPRRMATVPLPTATTRQDLFGSNRQRHK